MPLLRLASYNLGVNITDKTKGAKLPGFFQRLKKDAVDLIMLQEVSPYVGQTYGHHAGVEMALNQAPYTFGMAWGNCATGGADLVSCVHCHQFPGSNLDKYHWRMFSKSTFRHAGLLVTVINSHTRAGGGSHDTADSFRIDVLRRCRQEVITCSATFDIVIVAGDFNLLRPWKASTSQNVEAEMTIPGIQAFFEHSVPDHLVCYITNSNVQAHNFRMSPIPGIGKSYDGIGDHEGILVDLEFSVPIVSVPDKVVLPSSLQLPFVAKVTTAWESIGGGYMSLQPNALVCITYIGDSNKPDEAGWCFGKMCGQEQSGWFPATTATKIIACKAVADWSTADGGYLMICKGDIVEMLYNGTSEDDIGWIYGMSGSQVGWCPLHCVELSTTL